jgi:hypothetical protein
MYVVRIDLNVENLTAGLAELRTHGWLLCRSVGGGFPTRRPVHAPAAHRGIDGNKYSRSAREKNRLAGLRLLAIQDLTV